MSTSSIVSTAITNDNETKTPAAARLLSGYLERKELSQQLGKSERYLARQEELKIGPPVTRIGKKILYRISSVQRWLDEQESRPATARARRRPSSLK